MHLNNMFNSLVNLMNRECILFVRMTSDIGLSGEKSELGDGRFLLPDGSTRYLITRDRITSLIKEHGLTLVEPVKTVNVDEARCMTTLVLSKR